MRDDGRQPGDGNPAGFGCRLWVVGKSQAPIIPQEETIKNSWKSYFPLDTYAKMAYIAHSEGAKAVTGKTKTRQNSQRLHLRLSPELKALLLEAANVADLGVSDWMRDRLTRAARRDIRQAEDWKKTTG